MAARNDDSILFVVEWFDPFPQMKRQYLLKYFVDQHMVEMVDIKSKKMFLKKSPCPQQLTKDDFYVGNKIFLYSRELDIVDFGDLKTRERFAQQVQQTIVILPASTYSQWGKILDALTKDLLLIQANSFLFTANQSDHIIEVLQIESNRLKTSGQLSEGVSLVVVLQADDSYVKTQQILQYFQQYRMIGWMTSNGLQTSELFTYLFQDKQTMNSQFPSTSTLDNCTCCIVKPHAVKARQLGLILNQIIEQGYEISAIRSLLFEKQQAEEFLEVYKGVLPEYPDHVIQLSSGLCVALEIRAQDAVETFRVTAGPWDVEMAKELRPETIRGKFGLDKIRNSIHCTDLSDDAELECEYCFRLM